jgi:hypothetical protein
MYYWKSVKRERGKIAIRNYYNRISFTPYVMLYPLNDNLNALELKVEMDNKITPRPDYNK